ncbi:uncharacterized protein LOC114436280 isoform X1 [Parambassis ranga]|uniref:Uncharacterized protein LOC114436280 isoform X1 n=1 Tax=Parambassis ranga TaxID=210632 RepID=A0A6P7IC56_9TELE|nr:leucine-rich repeat-containing protein 72 isoform X1 [Parambassis ranga]
MKKCSSKLSAWIKSRHIFQINPGVGLGGARTHTATQAPVVPFSMLSGSHRCVFILLAAQNPSSVSSPSFSPYWNPALLGRLERLSTLILDCNNYTSHVKFPYMPSITTLCINKNKVTNLPVFVEEIRRKFPSIKILSMMNNKAAPSYFNGGSLTQYIDYRLYVISQIPGLKILDDTEVLDKERVQAQRTYWLQQSTHNSRKRREDSSRRYTHMQKKAVIRQQGHMKAV